MNQFLDKFGESIRNYWEDISESLRQQLLKDILEYANTNPQTFRQDVGKIQFDYELMPLPVILEALSKDTDNWGQFFVDTLDAIFKTAETAVKPQVILRFLSEFTYIENDERPFVQKIVDRLYNETDADNLAIKLAALWMLPVFLTNPSVKNKSQIIDALQQKLNDKNWKVRYVTYKSLSFDDLLPAGYKLAMVDRLRKYILGAPPTV